MTCEYGARFLLMPTSSLTMGGDNLYTGCGLGLKQDNAHHPYPLHDGFAQVRQELRDMLGSSIADRGKKLTFLKG